ncbi:MAG TPA: preprotein translocase subunit SecE [Bacillota bacterium]|nr:preprotein translocase subunit SecE [Bacillota bacterium]HPE39223.1 preprotein translocase subunit SecE [Bacillota bacterium]
MAEKTQKKNIFKRIGQRLKEIRNELKKVIWPTKEKLVQTSAVVLVVIALFAIFLTAIGTGAKYLLDKAGFYTQNEETTATTTAAPTETTVLETTAETSATESEVTDETDATTAAETDATTAAE